MGKDNPKKVVEYLPLTDLDLEAVVSCSMCGTIFNQEAAENCPRCGGAGLNPGPEKEGEEENPDFDGSWDE